MRVRFSRYISIILLMIFIGTGVASCASKKKCTPPCPTWSKKHKH